MNELEVNDWLCRSDVQTQLREKELHFHTRNLDLRPTILYARYGTLSLIGKGALSISFEVIDMNKNDASEEARAITGVVLDQMGLAEKSEVRNIDLHPLNEPTQNEELLAKVIPFRRNN